MKRQYEFGPADTLRFEDVPDPVPGEGQVLVQVAAAGVHLLDTSIRAGMTGGPFPPPRLPMTPGREVAGVVAGVGPGVESSWADARSSHTWDGPAVGTQNWRWLRPPRCTPCPRG